MLLARTQSITSNRQPSLRVARWCRVSTEEQSKEGRAGLQRQYDQTDRIIGTHGYELVESFEVIAVSGASIMHAPEFQRLIRLVQSGTIHAVVVAEMSRLMRVDSWEGMAVLDVFARHKVHIIADGVDIDFSNPEGFLSGGIQTLIAGHERMKLVQKILAAKTALKRQGKLTGGEHTLPFAVRYDWDTHKFYYDPDEIWRVQEAYRLIDEDGLYNIAEIGRRVGFSRSSVRVILENKIYIGIRRYDTKRDMNVKRVGPDGRRTYRPRPKCDPDEVIEVKVIDEPAVSVERWTRVNQVIAESRTNHVAKLPKEKLVHLCTSYGRCGYCGCTLYLCGNGKRDKATGQRLVWYCCRSHHPGRKGDLPRCNNRYVGEKKLDAVLIAFTNQVLTDPDLLTKLIAGSLKLSAEVIRPFPQQANESAITKLERKETRLIEMCTDGAISVTELKRERAKIREEIVRLRTVTANGTAEGQSLTLEDLARLVIKGALRFQRLTDKREQKAILEQLFAEVFFREQSITAFRFHPALVASMGENGRELGQVINLEKPFRISVEIPEGRKQCSKCGVILPVHDFPKSVSRCRPCYRESRRDRDRVYWERKKARRKHS